VSELGSRYETPGVNTGVTNLLELLAFGACSPEYPSAAAIAHTLQDWGATRFVSAGREQSIHCIDILRPNVDKAVHLLAQTLCQPDFPEEEVEEAKRAILFQSMPTVTPPELYLQEALQRAAYGENQQLGKPHFCPPNMVDKLTRQTCLDYWKTQFLANPKGLVVGGAGVNHDQLVRLVEDHFGHLQQQDENRVPLTLCRYQGGYAEFQIPPPPDFDPAISVDDLSAADKDKRLTRVAVALETSGWHGHDDLVAACVLQTLLGGGSSFSAGGPGKGMYSRLYRQVLNMYSWAESAEAFTAFHSESGLFGIAGSAQPKHAHDLTKVLSEHLGRLATRTVTEGELSRARNMLKCNVLTQLESRLVLFEDMARQVLTYGKREGIAETCRKIDAVTAADVQRIAVKGLQNGPPTVAAVGIDISKVPRHGEVSEWFRSNAS
jgi:processing peptidase subunit alpha